MTSRSRRPLHYIVEVHGFDTERKPTLAILSHHNTQKSAFTVVVGILQQWQASEGAVAIGTKVKIKDTRDGGTIWYMEYLGYEAETLLGR